MKVKLIKQFGKLKPGTYDWAAGVVKKLTDMGYIEKPKAKKEKVVYEDKNLKENAEDK